MPPNVVNPHVAALSEFLAAAAPSALAAPGLAAPSALAPPGAAPPGDSAAAPSAALADQRQALLLNLALAATTKVIDRFEPLKSKIRGRVLLAEGFRFWGQMLTMVLSSTVVGSIVTGRSYASIVLGFLTLATSLFGFVANSIIGSDSKFVDEFGEASAKYEAAAQLRDRLLIYGENPNLFLDIDDRIKEADDLRRYLTEKIEKWGLKL